MANNPSNPRGSGFTNLSNYLQANQQNRLGSSIGAGITSSANQASQGLQQASQDFQGAAQRGQLATDANRQAREVVLGRLASGATTPPTDQEVQQFGKYLGGQYAGPTALGNQFNLAQSANKAESLGRGLSTAEGRQGLLQQFVGAPQYTSGQQKLDNLLLGATGGKELAQAKQKTVGLTNAVARESQRAASTAAQNQAAAQKFGEETKNQINAQKSTISTPLQQQLDAAQKAQQDAMARIQESAKTGQFTAQDMAMLGLTEGQNLYDVNVAQNLNPVINPTLGGLATDQQKAQLSALAKLSGQDVGQFYQGFDPNAQHVDVNKPVTLRNDFQDLLKSRGQELSRQADMGQVDLSKSYQQYGNRFDPANPEYNWIVDPSQLKNATLGGAKEQVGAAANKFNTTLNELYQEITGGQPWPLSRPITMQDLAPKQGMSELYNARANQAFTYANGINNAIQQAQAGIKQKEDELMSKYTKKVSKKE